MKMSREARTAAIQGTRQMIAEDSFTALVDVLVDCRAVPRTVMAEALDGLANRLAAKARGELDTEFVVHRAEAFDRARDLLQQAAALRSASGPAPTATPLVPPKPAAPL